MESVLNYIKSNKLCKTNVCNMLKHAVFRYLWMSVMKQIIHSILPFLYFLYWRYGWMSGLMESCLSGWFFAQCSWDFKLILDQTHQCCGYINIFPLAFSLVATSGWESPSVSLYRYYETLPSVAAFKWAAVPAGYSSF